MLTSPAVSRLRPLQVHVTANNALASSSTSLLRLRRPVQIRSFRFGMWSSYLDPAYDRELRRRYRTLKHNIANNINRKLAWHEHPLAKDPRLTLKRAVTRHWAPTTTGYRSRWVNQDELDNRRRTSSPLPDTASVFEDFLLRRAASWTSQYNQLSDLLSQKILRDANLKSEVDMKSERPHRDGNTKQSGPQSATQIKTDHVGGQDYVIDPITNRKVLRREYGPVEIDLELPTQTFQAHDSHFAPFDPSKLDQERQPIYSNGQPPASELSKYAENKFDDWPATSAAGSTESSARPETASYVFDSSTLKNEEYALNHLPLDDPVEDHDELDKDQTETPDKPVEKYSSKSKTHHVVDTLGPDSSVPFDSPSQFGAKPDQLESELRNYGPYMHNENSPTQIDSEDIKDLEKYRYQSSEEPESSTEPSTVYDDLHRYAPTALGDIKDQDQPFDQYGGLEKYKAFRLEHLGINAALERERVTEDLKEYAAEEHKTAIPDLDTCVSNMPKKIPKMKLPGTYDYSKGFSTHDGAEILHQDTDKHRENHDEIFEYLQRIWDSRGVQITPTVLPAVSKEPQGQENKETVKNTEKHLEDPSSATEKATLEAARGPISNIYRLEPALDRRASTMKGNRSNHTSGADLYSKEPQGLETSFAEECGGRHTMPLYKRTYGSECGQVATRSKSTVENEAQESSERLPDSYYHRDPEIDGIPSAESNNQAQGQKATQPDEPTVYKILAYDPTKQTISVAQTTSVVPDLASPLSPTEVLLRLSNPVKFLPHFAPLQAEGFEIVSGGGDILVFRQVRPAKVAAEGGTAYVNPIDMMGRSAAVPNAAAFVSPTGFVNYDIPRVEEESGEPPFRSNIDVRREEPVFSGRKSLPGEGGSKESKKPRMNVGKRIIIGGAWVAGISYSLGVVSEYFQTGGTDGKGPTGFSPV
ncbi:hypothetical protein F5Y12DRAFT_67625 [Xylaria sp. FL1777]|nr:hypothetical protein F5Y12DRAFT_67625 [Xylaria sp. FL1777]